MSATAIIENPKTFLSQALTPNDVVSQVALVQEVMSAVMKKDEHYGVIPGCGTKPTLLQPGAQKLALTFNLAPEYTISKRELDGGHREYEVVCRLISRQTGMLYGEGVGNCSTMESKYRYRGAELTDLEMDVPKGYWDIPKDQRKSDYAYELLGGKNRVVQKIDGIWGVYEKGDRKENPDIADTFNTVLKMAKKRAYVDAVLTNTAAADIFTQDLEDLLPAQKIEQQPIDEFRAAFRVCVNENAYKGVTVQSLMEAVERAIGTQIKTATNDQIEFALKFVTDYGKPISNNDKSPGYAPIIITPEELDRTAPRQNLTVNEIRVPTEETYMQYEAIERF